METSASARLELEHHFHLKFNGFEPKSGSQQLVIHPDLQTKFSLEVL
jgi:hypothetical protein